MNVKYFPVSKSNSTKNFNNVSKTTVALSVSFSSHASHFTVNIVSFLLYVLWLPSVHRNT